MTIILQRVWFWSIDRNVHQERVWRRQLRPCEMSRHQMSVCYTQTTHQFMSYEETTLSVSVYYTQTTHQFMSYEETTLSVSVCYTQTTNCPEKVPLIKEDKRKERRFVRRSIVRSSPLKRSGMDHTVVKLQTHHTCLYLVSVHQTAPNSLVIAAIWLQLTTHLLTPGGWKAELA